MKWNVFMLGDTSTNPIQIHSLSKHTSTQEVLIPCGGICYLAYVCCLFPPIVLSQLVESCPQPAAAAACSGVLKPDILEVSRVILCKISCAYLCLAAENIITSLKQN
jgi:hypothetical protein